MKNLISFTLLIVLLNLGLINCNEKAENKLKIGIKKRVRICAIFAKYSV